MQLQDKEEAFSLYAQLGNVLQIVFSLSAARVWIHAAEHFQHSTMLLAYEISLRLLFQHLAILPSLPRLLVILKNLTSSLAVDAFSAYRARYQICYPLFHGPCEAQLHIYVVLITGTPLT